MNRDKLAVTAYAAMVLASIAGIVAHELNRKAAQ